MPLMVVFEPVLHRIVYSRRIKMIFAASGIAIAVSWRVWNALWVVPADGQCRFVPERYRG